MPKNACGTCGKEFPDSAHLKRHLANKKPCIKVNPEDKNKCIPCDKTFSCLSNLYKHRNRFHPEIAENRRIANDLAHRRVTNNDVQAAVLPVADNDVQAHDEQLLTENPNDWDDENGEGEMEMEADETQLVLDQTHIVNESNFFKFGDKKIRKTTENPQRISVYDLVAAITDQDTNNGRTTFMRMKNTYNELAAICSFYKFPGRGRQTSPVTDARGTVVIMNMLPGRKAAQFRLACAEVMVRYLGGDETLIAEIRRNHDLQGVVDETNPMALFGDAAGPPIVFHPSSSLELKSVTGVTNFRQSQYYLRRVRGNWHNVHPVGRPQDVLTAEELAGFAVIKAGAQGEITGRQGTHLTTYSDSTLLDSCLTSASHLAEQRGKDHFINLGQLYEGLHEGKTVRDYELILVRNQEEYEAVVAVVQRMCADAIDIPVQLKLAQEKSRQMEADARKMDADARKMEADADARKTEATASATVRMKELELEMLRLQYEMRK